MAEVIINIEADNVPDGYDLNSFLDLLDTWLQARGIQYRVSASKNILERFNREGGA